MHLRRSCLPAILLCLLVLAACSGAAATDRMAHSVSPSTRGPSGPVAGYLQAVATDLPEEARAGLTYAAAGSPAAVYLEHQANRMQAELAGALTLYPGTVSAKRDGTRRVCDSGSQDCARFADFSVDRSDRVVTFSVDGRPIATRLASGDGNAVTGSLGSVTFLTAYNSVRNDALVVTLRLHADATPLSPRLYGATFTGPDGARQRASTAYGTTDVPAHSDAVVELVFPAAPPRGRVTVGACARTSCRQHFAVTVDVG